MLLEGSGGAHVFLCVVRSVVIILCVSNTNLMALESSLGPVSVDFRSSLAQKESTFIKMVGMFEVLHKFSSECPFEHVFAANFECLE